MVKAALVPSLVAAIAAVLFATLGPTKTIAVVFGIILSAAIFEWPIVGLVAVFFSETCFQVLGSAHLTGLPVSVGKLLGTLTLAMWALKFLRDRIALTYSPQMLALLGYFCAMVVVSLLVHPLEPAPENGFFKFLQVALLFWLTANIAGQSRQLLLAACFGLSAAIAGAGVIGILEHFVPSFGIEADDPALQLGALGGVLDRDSLDGVTIRRITGGLGDSNWLAYTLAAVIPLNLFWWHRVRAIPAAAVVIAIAGLQVLGLVLSYTRAGLVGLAVAIGYLLWRRALPPGPVFAAALVGSLVALFWLPAGFVDRMFSLQYLEEGSTPMRKDLTGTALYFALQRPILGYGYGQFGVEFMRRTQHRSVDPGRRVGRRSRAGGGRRARIRPEHRCPQPLPGSGRRIRLARTDPFLIVHIPRVSRPPPVPPVGRRDGSPAFLLPSGGPAGILCLRHVRPCEISEDPLDTDRVGGGASPRRADPTGPRAAARAETGASPRRCCLTANADAAGSASEERL